jgi:hypothetical protein
MAPVSNILGTYSPESVVITVGNDKFSHIVSGYADGTFISVARNVDHATHYNGADGTNARVVRSIKNCDVTLTLHQSSESNDVFSQLLALDEESRDGSDCFYMTIKDTSGRTVMSTPVAYIGTTPDTSLGTDIAERAWVIRAINMTQHIGGNGKFTGDTYSTVTDLGYNSDTFWNPNA